MLTTLLKLFKVLVIFLYNVCAAFCLFSFSKGKIIAQKLVEF